MRQIVVIAHNIRSTHNVGSLFRTAEGMGVNKLFLTGYTPYPLKVGDPRLPHIADKISKQIEKTALGAQSMVIWEQSDDVLRVLELLKKDGFTITALEQTAKAVPINKFDSPEKIAILLGNETEGVSTELLKRMDTHLVIPMFGQKESFNVVQATAMALFHLRLSEA